MPNVPGKWKEVVNDNTVTWLANWVENVNGNYKYVFLAAGSSIKGQSDWTKFEKARELKVSSIAYPSCGNFADTMGTEPCRQDSVRLQRTPEKQEHG